MTAHPLLPKVQIESLGKDFGERGSPKINRRPFSLLRDL